jgi:RNA polymerase sigma factor (sigma-70 family)
MIPSESSIRAADRVGDARASILLEARQPDPALVEELLKRCLPSLTRLARKRVPPAARGSLDTEDLVQETVLRVIRRLDSFTPRHPEAIQAYCHVALLNLVRDIARRLSSRPTASQLSKEMPCPRPTPFDEVIESDSYRRYRRALRKLSPKSRSLLIARIEWHWTVHDIALRFKMPSENAVRTALWRAARHLARMMSEPSRVHKTG